MKPLFIGLVTGAAAALPLLTPSPAHAISCAASSGLSATGTCTITDAGNTYDISLVTDTFANAFPTPSTDNMFWWGDGGKAESAVLAVGGAFGYINGSPSIFGPYFAYALQPTFVNLVVPAKASFAPSGFIAVITGESASSPVTWARSSLVSSAAVPGPLPVLGAAAAFGLSRKLRKRIMQSRSIVRAQAVA